MADTVAVGRRYTGPKVSMTSVSSGRSVTVKSSGQILTAGGKSATTVSTQKTPSTSTSSSSSTNRTSTTTVSTRKTPSTSTSSSSSTNRTSTTTPKLPTTLYGGVDVGALQIEQAKQATAPGPTIAKAQTLQGTTSTPQTITSQPSTISGGGGSRRITTTPTTLYGGVDVGALQIEQAKTTTQPGPTKQKATTKTITATPTAYTTARTSTTRPTNILPSVYAGTEEELLAQRPTYTPQIYQQAIPLKSYLSTEQLGPTKQKATITIEPQYTPDGVWGAAPKRTFLSKFTAPIKQIASSYKTGFTLGDVGQYQYTGTGWELLGAGAGVVTNIALIGWAPGTKPASAIASTITKIEKPILALKSGGALQKVGYYGYTGLKALGVGEVTYLGYKSFSEKTSFTPSGVSEVSTGTFKASYTKAEQSAQANMGLGSRLLYSVSPVASRTISKITGIDLSQKGTFEQQFIVSQQRQGITGEEARQNLQLALKERSIRGEAQLASFIASSAVIELSGRGGFVAEFKKLSSKEFTRPELAWNVFKTSSKILAPLGAVEGAGQSIIQQQSEGRKVTAGETLYSAGFGALSATLLGGLIAVGSVTQNKLLRSTVSTIGNVGDISEKPGDIVADIVTAGKYSFYGIKTEVGTVRMRVPGVYSYSTTFVPSSKSSVPSVVKTPSMPSLTSKPTSFGLPKSFLMTPSPGSVIPSVVKTPSIGSLSISTPTPVPSSSRSFVTTPTPIPIPSESNIPIPIETNIPVPTQTNIPIPSESNIPIPIETNIPVPVFTPQSFGFPLNIGAGWGAGFVGGIGGGRRSKGKYTPSFKALYLGIRGKMPSGMGGLYTGQEFRPIIGMPTRKKKKGKFKYSKKKVIKSYNLSRVMAAI